MQKRTNFERATSSFLLSCRVAGHLV